MVYGVLWGVGGLTFGLSMRYLGVALGQSIALGTCAGFGTLFPALFAGKDLLHGEGLMLLIGVCITLAGIAIIGYAGSLRSKNMTEEEKALCRNAIAEYKTIRPVVQFGDIYRLLSPYDKQGAASLMYVSPEKDKAVFYWWKTEHFCNRHLPRVKMAGLAPDKYYKVHELNRIDTEPLKFEGKSFSGAYLNDNGLEIPSTHRVEPSKQNEYASRVLYLEEVTPSFSDNRIEQRPPLRVLCLGNSITRHEYKADIEWFSYYDVRGIGKARQGRIYRGVVYDTSTIERILISIVVRDKNTEKTVQAIIKAAVETKSPVILQVSKGARQYANATLLRYMAQGAVEYAKELGCAHPEIVLHLDHGDTFETCKSCIDSGFSSVMIDGSHLPYEENVALTKKVVEYAHQFDVTVEGELGVLAGVEDEVSSDHTHTLTLKK